MENTSGQGSLAVIPEGVVGWSWGAFLLHWIWGLGNKTYIAFLTFVPIVSLVMIFVLGFKGREWAWRNKHWDSIEHFQHVQRRWSQWGVGIILGSFLLGILAAILIPIVAGHSHPTPPAP